MKRFLALLLCCAMLLGVVGCGKNNDTGSSGTNPSTSDGGNGTAEGAAAIYRKLYSSEVTTLAFPSLLFQGPPGRRGSRIPRWLRLMKTGRAGR